MTLCKYYQIQCQDCDFRSSYYPSEPSIEDEILHNKQHRLICVTTMRPRPRGNPNRIILYQNPKYPELNGIPMLDGRQYAAKLINLLTAKRYPSRDFEDIEKGVDETRPFRDGFISRETNVENLERYRNHLMFLEMLIRDTIPMLQNAIESRKTNEELFKP